MKFALKIILCAPFLVVNGIIAGSQVAARKLRRRFGYPIPRPRFLEQNRAH